MEAKYVIQTILSEYTKKDCKRPGSICSIRCSARIKKQYGVPFLKSQPQDSKKNIQQDNLSDALFQALKDPTYIMLFLGFFSCGFQLAFITAHFPAFIAESSSPIIEGSLLSLVCN